MDTLPLPQEFRPVCSVSAAANFFSLPDVVKIEPRFDNKTQEYIVLWSDISTAFKNPLLVRNEGVLVPFLTDENFEVCKPLRIRARPNIVLEVVLETPQDSLGPRETNTPHPASTTIENQTQGTGSTPRHDIGGVSGTGAPISDVHDLPPQYTREDNVAGSGTLGNSTFSTNQTTTITSNANALEVGILRDTTGRGSDDYKRGLQYYYGKGVLVNYSVAKEWFLKASDQGHVAAIYYLGYMSENGLGSAQDPAAALPRYIEAGSRGYDIDQRNAGVVRGNNQGKLAKALHWYREAADRGDAKAQCVLGYMHHHGTGALKNYRKAREWYTKAVDQGYDNAQNNLGVMCECGEGSAKNHHEALELYFKAAFQGHVRAQFNIGLSYEFNRGVSKNMSKAKEWYAKSADLGSVRAQSYLGDLYCDGVVFQRNYPKALELLRRAAIQGDVSAQIRLGSMYFRGEGVERNPSLAREWWSKAAAQGNIIAKMNLMSLGIP
ncbi:hypothetical protein BGX26_007222 [Mortierella sp. AD094]|nr:hypothetical protein BGX26_007222 [Mortierella sp. AD094]